MSFDPEAMRKFNEDLITQFRANSGEIKSGMFAGAPILLLTTIGAKSGERRTMPLAFTRDGDSYVVIASKGGAPTHPAWFHNLVAHPEVTIEVGGEKMSATARVAEGEERDRLFRAQAELMPNFDDYQKNTTRVIPVVVLEPTG